MAMDCGIPINHIIKGDCLKAPFSWFGGKRRVAHVVWSRLGDIPNYVEPFAGSLACLLARPHWPFDPGGRNHMETVNDLDYASLSKKHDNQNAGRERIWFSPGCLQPVAGQRGLFESAPSVPSVAEGSE